MKAARQHPVRSLLINLALVAVAFGLLALVVRGHRVQIREVFSRSIDARPFALGFAIYLVALLSTYTRWFWLVRVIDPVFRLRDAVLLGFIGNVFNLVIPGAVGGDLIKAAYLVKMKINSTQAIASMVIDRILGLLGLFLLASVAGLAAWRAEHVTTQVRALIVVVWIAVAAGFIGLALIFTQTLTRRNPALLAGPGKLATILRELQALSTAYRQRLGVVSGCIALSCVIHGSSVLAFYTVSRALFPKALPTLGQHFLMVPLTLFTMAAPIPFGALGLSEGVSDQLFKLVHHPEGALSMMGFRVLMYAGGLVSVCFYVANLRQVRALTDTAEHLET